MEKVQLSSDTDIINISDVILVEFINETDSNIGIKRQFVELTFDMLMPIEFMKHYIIQIDNLVWTIQCGEIITKEKGWGKIEVIYRFKRIT